MIAGKFCQWKNKTKQISFQQSNKQQTNKQTNKQTKQNKTENTHLWSLASNFYPIEQQGLPITSPSKNEDMQIPQTNPPMHILIVHTESFTPWLGIHMLL